MEHATVHHHLAASGRATLAALVDPSVTLPSPRRQSLSLYRQAFAQELEKDLANLSIWAWFIRG
jgi:hypothetical protein